MTRRINDTQRQITCRERAKSKETPFNTPLGVNDGLSAHEAYIANMSDEEYLDYCDATGRA